MSGDTIEIRFMASKFEEKVKELESIVSFLEKDELDLEESLKKYELGIKLVKECNAILDATSKKITILQAAANGEVKEEDFPDAK